MEGYWEHVQMACMSWHDQLDHLIQNNFSILLKTRGSIAQESDIEWTSLIEIVFLYQRIEKSLSTLMSYL